MRDAREYVRAIEWLYRLEPRGIEMRLERVEDVLARRGNPHRHTRFVHVAGTNGKGSVAALIEAGLRRAGVRSALYTSPHLHRFVERIRIAGRPVSQTRVARKVASLRETLEDPDAPALTFFEATTVLAFECFRDTEVDVAVVEVGMGGRLDATNVIDPLLSVITSVALDHTHRLGETVGEVAREKAGILRAGTPAIIGVRDPEASATIAGRIRALGVDARWIGRDFDAHPSSRRGRVDVTLDDDALRGLRQPIPGAHQRDNVAIAVAAMRALSARRLVHVRDDAIRLGLERARWPGRLERIGGHPPVLLDAAHNAAGCEALGAHLDGLSRRGRRVLVFGAMDDKDHHAMLAAFDGRVDTRIYTAVPMSKAMPPESLARIRAGRCAPSVRDAIARAQRAAGADGLVVVAGSIFVMAEARTLLRGVARDPLIAM